MSATVTSGAVLHILNGAIADQARRTWLAREADLPKHDGAWSVEVLSRVWTLSLRETGRSALPIEIAAKSTLDEWGLLALVVRTAPTAREALFAGARCHRLITDRGTASIEERDGKLWVLWRSPEPTCEAEAAADLSTLSHFAQGVRELIGPILFSEVSLRAPAPKDQAVFQRFFAAPIRFGAEENAFAIDPSSIDRAPPQAHRALFDHLQAEVEQRLPRSKDWLEQLDQIIADQLKHRAINFREAARMLALSPRSLQRRLTEAGTTFRARTDQSRRSLALARLNAGGSIGEISDALGFSDPSAFSRAHRRWTGRAPSKRS